MFYKNIYTVLSALLIAATLASCGSGEVTVQTDGTGNNGARLLSISVTPTNPTIAQDTSQNFIATGIYSDNTTKDLTEYVIWSASDMNIASLDTLSVAGSSSEFSPRTNKGGHAYGKGSGSTTITATIGDYSGSTTITVTSATLESLTVTPSNASIAEGTVQQFTAMGTFSDDTTQDMTTQVSWNSSNTAAAKISSSGLASSVSTGSATVTAASGSISGSTTLTVTPAMLVSIAVSPTNPSIAKGTSQQLTATGTYSDNTTQNLTTAVTWNSSNTGAATISASGLAASAAAGSTTISAALGSITGSTTLIVNPAILVSLAVTPTNPSISRGTTQQFKATGTFSDNTTQDLTAAATWSTDTAAATISNAAGSKGLATGAAAGSATIMAISGSISGSTMLTVTAATLVSITVTPTNPSIAKGTNQQFTATGTYSDSSTQNLTTAVSWSSSNTSVATISNAAGSNGLATSVAAGSITIKATSGSVSGSAVLTATPATLVSITIIPANPSIAKGTKQQFAATGKYSDNTTQNLTTAVTWSSSNTGAATISNAAGSNGLATSVATGSTTVTATSGSVSGSTTLTVTAATLTSIAITPVNPSIAQGTTQQFIATGAYSDGTTQNLTAAVTWGSSNAGIATISNATGSKGLAAAVAAGTTTITATSGSVSGTATLTVTAIITGSATLAWDAPATNTDGTPLTDLAGYKIYYGISSGNYASVIDVGNVTTYTITNLSSGVYYFAVTSYDSSGIESAYSNEANKIIQ